MNAINYDQVMREEAARAAGSRLLLHSCCAPCSSYCLQELRSSFRTTVLYYNPNLDCEEEYRKRKLEQIRLLKETGWADFLDCDYAPEDYEAVAAVRARTKEGGEGCFLCYALRLEKTALTAKERGYDYFSTTLTVSPLKNAGKINEIGLALEQKYGVKYLPSDFKKRNGYLQSVALSRKYGLYRQNYCGCRFSLLEAQEREHKN